MTNTIKDLLKNLVILLVMSKYKEIIKNKENGRLTEEEIKTAINSYPGVISLPPDSAYNSINIYAIYDDKTQARNIEFDLWYDNKVSDLTLEAVVYKTESGKFCIAIDDIHVL